MQLAFTAIRGLLDEVAKLKRSLPNPIPPGTIQADEPLSYFAQLIATRLAESGADVRVSQGGGIVPRTSPIWDFDATFDGFGMRRTVEEHRTHQKARAESVEAYKRNIGLLTNAVVQELRGKNLACWCPLDKPCHADVLLELANRNT